MKLTSALLAGFVALSTSACVSAAPAQYSALQAEVRQSVADSQARQLASRQVLPDVLNLPLWPGHLLVPECVRDPARSACVVIVAGEDDAEAYKVRDAYIAVLESKGWQMKWPRDQAPVLLRSSSDPHHCVQISFGVWDDGRAARIRLKPMLRFELDPPQVDCENPGETPPELSVIPGHRG